MPLSEENTICAIATAPGRGGVGIIRISGPKVTPIAKKILGFEPTNRLAHACSFLDLDGSIIDKFGPDGISKVIKYFSARAVKFQSGYIYQYAFIMLLGFSVLLTLLILV